MKYSVPLIVFLSGFLVFTLISATLVAALVWNIETVDNTRESTGWENSIALDSSGNPHISYSVEISYGVCSLMYAWRDETGWHNETVDSGGWVGGGKTSIALDSYGNPHISYFNRSSGDLKYAWLDGTGWHTETVDTMSKLGLGGAYTSLVLDSSNNPHISYYYFIDVFHGYLKYAWLDGTGWHTETVDMLSDGSVGGSNSIALDSYGNPHVSYNDFTDGSLKYASRDGTGWHTETVDSESSNYGVGYTPSLALDSGNNPHISYYDWPNGVAVSCHLKYAWWDGSGWQIEIVDTVTPAGGTRPIFDSLALDSGDNPHVSYINFATESQGYLMYATKSGSAWSTEIVDPMVGTQDPWNSIALDSYGNPHICYSDSISYSLKYATVAFVPPQVVPEVPVGTIVASAAMVIALVGYITVPKLRRNRLHTKI